MNLDDADLDNSPSKSAAARKRKLSEEEGNGSQQDPSSAKRGRIEPSTQTPSPRLVGVGLHGPVPGTGYAIAPQGQIPIHMQQHYARMVPPPIPMQLPYLQQQMLPPHLPVQMPRVPPAPTSLHAQHVSPAQPYPGVIPHPAAIPQQIMRQYAAGNHIAGPGEEKQPPLDNRLVEQQYRMSMMPMQFPGLSQAAPQIQTTPLAPPPQVTAPQSISALPQAPPQSNGQVPPTGQVPPPAPSPSQAPVTLPAQAPAQNHAPPLTPEPAPRETSNQAPESTAVKEPVLDDARAAQAPQQEAEESENIWNGEPN